MNVWLGVNDVLDFISKWDKLKKSGVSKELEDISNRLKDKKQTKDTVAYIEEFIASPGSEVVRQGSRAMQLGDAMARWTLFNSDVNKDVALFIKKNKRKPNEKELLNIKDTAGIKALDTFIDYRLNVPREIKILSDYGILMFPSFWIRVQRIIFNLIKYHPFSSASGYLIADTFNMNGASIMDANLVNKYNNNTLVQPGQDVLDLNTFILGF